MSQPNGIGVVDVPPGSHAAEGGGRPAEEHAEEAHHGGLVAHGSDEHGLHAPAAQDADEGGVDGASWAYGPMLPARAVQAASPTDQAEMVHGLDRAPHATPSPGGRSA